MSSDQSGSKIKIGGEVGFDFVLLLSRAAKGVLGMGRKNARVVTVLREWCDNVA